MTIIRPYKRTLRPFVNGNLSGQYPFHSQYAQSPELYTRAFLILLNDLKVLFEYIEPADVNSNCYSYRIHALLLRTCVEVEANFKAILKENGYIKSKRNGEDDLSRKDYRKVEATHRLSSYEVKIPYWKGNENIRKPFIGWAASNDGSLPWYDAYNASKHDRNANFYVATLNNLVDSICGLLVVLSAQFYYHDYSPGPGYLLLSQDRGGWDLSIGYYFEVKYPQDWPMEMRYEFDWETIKNDPNPFQLFDYKKIP